MNKAKPALAVIWLAMLAASSHADAAITAPTFVDFGVKPDRASPNPVLPVGAYYGHANTAPGADGTCNTTACIYQNGLVVGTLSEAINTGGHLHALNSVTDSEVSYHADAPGVYIRALDSTAFSLHSIQFKAPYAAEGNPYAGGTPIPESFDPAIHFYEIIGFSSALNPELTNGDGTHYSNRVAYQTIENGFSGTLALNQDFANVAAVWIHFHGAQSVEDIIEIGAEFKVQIDDIAVDAPTAVPLPAASWILGSGLLGLISIARKNRQPTSR
ncbi:VPLPA-CTERM sorting domain-containing protein [Methylomonas fluvii]|uniref:VPLPA-CTERM sorting domain-containing protein n=1 Tax=Methylomonas fluvii TaxID=1854564 RepID=A0ABR9DJI2_9GAMM|nr:VPLPA-CTERM sorting domain-containing protein [Methylomonas fluvii]MBD9363185.1 VPLPA-CTERM sorting domain-containing protein [Methylomonas fluvii]